MKLEFSVWTSHLNQIIYSYFYFCKNEKREVNIEMNKNIKYDCAVLYINNETICFDYSDDSRFADVPEKFDYYFKRSLLLKDKMKNVYPLNFHFSITYNSYCLLMNLKSDILFNKFNRTEVVRALDKFSFFTNSSHEILDIKNYSKEIIDYGGNIIFHTRLWNPKNTNDFDEKQRREAQNEFRINACRLIKRTYKNSSVGLFLDDLSKQMAPDLLLDSQRSSKKKYFEILKDYNICIADDGLKDTPGWKIGEYVLLGKAIITTPINISMDNFVEHINYEKISSRNAFLEIPDKINYLLDGKKYLEMAENNLEWGKTYLHPKNYIKRILDIVNAKV